MPKQKEMLRRFFPAFIFLLIACAIWAQPTSLEELNSTRLKKQKMSMVVLGTWAVGNLATGSVLAGRRQGEDRYFHLMNVGWNVVNLSIAAAGYWSAAKSDPAALDLYNSIQAQHRLQNILLFNAGLDVGYMLGGLYLMERSKTTEKKPERLKGFGKSIVLQGAFLFAFDLTAYFVQASDNDKLKAALTQLTFTGQEAGLVLVF